METTEVVKSEYVVFLEAEVLRLQKVLVDLHNHGATWTMQSKIRDALALSKE